MRGPFDFCLNTYYLLVYLFLFKYYHLFIIDYLYYLFNVYIISNNKYNKYFYNEWISTVDILWRGFRRRSKCSSFCNPLYTLKILQSYKSYDFYNLTTLRIFSRWPSRGARFRCHLEWRGSSAAQALSRFPSILPAVLTVRISHGFLSPFLVYGVKTVL